MKRKFKLLLTLIIFSWQGMQAQVSLDTLLSIVARNNKQLQASSLQYEAEVLAAKVGNAPPNPEVEYGYMWGDPASVGDRVDFSVTQSFDFPTTYTSQSKLRNINSEQAGLKKTTIRQDVMAGARKSWIEAVYLNKKLKLLERRLASAEKVYVGFQKKLETGEGSQLQKNQSFLKMTLLKNEVNLIRTALENNSNDMMNLAGGVPVIIEDTVLPMPADLVLDSLLADYGQGPASRWYACEIEKRAKEKAVIFNKKLPKLMAGYYSESILGVDLRGVKAGISIPLWGEAHAVNRARAGMVYAESDAWRFKADQQTAVTNLYGRWESLKLQVEDLIEAVQTANNEALLIRSLEEGEISLTEYYYESDFFFQSRLVILESWRDMLKLEADLMKVYF